MYAIRSYYIGKPVVLGEQAYNMLKKAIIAGEFQPGEWLSEDQLTDTLGVSRTPSYNFV